MLSRLKWACTIVIASSPGLFVHFINSLSPTLQRTEGVPCMMVPMCHWAEVESTQRELKALMLKLAAKIEVQDDILYTLKQNAHPVTHENTRSEYRNEAQVTANQLDRSTISHETFRSLKPHKCLVCKPLLI